MNRPIATVLAGTTIIGVLIAAAPVHPTHADENEGLFEVTELLAAATQPTAMADLPTPLADLPFGAGDWGCGECDDTFGCPGMNPGHIAWQDDGGDNSRDNGWHPETCYSGDCGNHEEEACICSCMSFGNSREWCEDPKNSGCLLGGLTVSPTVDTGFDPTEYLFRDRMPDVWFGIRSGALSPVDVSQQFKNVEYNTARGALQVIGCSGRVVAHLPIPRPTE